MVGALLSLVVAAGAEGLIGKATDRELIVYFVAPTPNVSLRGNESIHPQLKPSFSGEFTGFFIVTNSGPVTLSGAAHIFVDGKDVANRATVLPEGQRKLRIPFKRSGAEELKIQLRANDEQIPASAFAHEKAPRELAENQSRDFGRRLFEDLNCGACHAPENAIIRFAAITNAPTAPAVRALRPTNGCLAEEPEENVPKFELSEKDREALQLFIQTPDISPAPMQDWPRLQAQLGCVKCHEKPFAPDAVTFEAALSAHQMEGVVTNLAAGDLRRLADLFSSQVATNAAKP